MDSTVKIQKDLHSRIPKEDQYWPTAGRLFEILAKEQRNSGAVISHALQRHGPACCKAMQSEDAMLVRLLLVCRGLTSMAKISQGLFWARCPMAPVRALPDACTGSA